MKKIIFLLLISCSFYNTFSQDILIPYRKGNKWGLADTMGKIVVEPAYDKIFVNKNKHKFYKVKHKFRTGLITNKKIIINPLHDSLNIDFYSKIIYTYNKVNDSTIVTIYNFNGNSILDSSTKIINHIYSPFLRSNIETLLYVYNTNNKHSLIIYNSLIQKSTFTNVKDVDKIKIFHFSKRVYIKTENQKKYNYYRFKLNKKRNYILVKASKRDQLIINKNESKIDTSNQINTSNQIKETSIKHKPFKQIKRADNKPYSNSFAFDSNKYYYIQSKNKYFYNSNLKDTVYSFNSISTESALEKIDIGYSYYYSKRSLDLSTNFIKYKKNNKYGIICFNNKGKIKTINAKYNSVKGFTKARYIKYNTYFKVSINNQYGIINDSGEIIVPIKYNKININLPKYSGIHPIIINLCKTVKSKNKWNFMDGSFYLILDHFIDSIIPLSNNNNVYLLIDNEKYGYINNKEILLPIFKYPVKGYLKLNGYLVWKLYSKNGAFLGYADSKGFQYFDN